jgi:guanylate kinase
VQILDAKRVRSKKNAEPALHERCRSFLTGHVSCPKYKFMASQTDLPEQTKSENFLNYVAISGRVYSIGVVLVPEQMRKRAIIMEQKRKHFGQFLKKSKKTNVVVIFKKNPSDNCMYLHIL